MGSVTGQCLVHKQAPGTLIATVEPEHREAIRQHFVTGKETDALIRYLERLHEYLRLSRRRFTRTLLTTSISPS